MQVLRQPEATNSVMGRRQTLTPFGTAPLQYQTAILARHTGTEAVRFGSPAVIGLKRSLRHSQ